LPKNSADSVLPFTKKPVSFLGTGFFYGFKEENTKKANHPKGWDAKPSGLSPGITGHGCRAAVGYRTF
jgi:hypothetical protein